MRIILFGFLGYLFSCLVALASDNGGRFEGELVVKFLPSETNVLLEKPIIYVDPSGIEWPVPTGTKSDGASVPQFAWVAFPPFAGRYIRAAVVHDYYCVTRNRPWRKVHRMFFDAMISADVDELTAKTMYAAVYTFGPRWSLDGATRAISTSPLSYQDQQTANDELATWIKANQPSLSEIDNFVNRERIRQVKN